MKQLEQRKWLYVETLNTIERVYTLRFKTSELDKFQSWSFFSSRYLYIKGVRSGQQSKYKL